MCVLGLETVEVEQDQRRNGQEQEEDGGEGDLPEVHTLLLSGMLVY
jgi:hypothetical protein